MPVLWKEGSRAKVQSSKTPTVATKHEDNGRCQSEPEVAEEFKRATLHHQVTTLQGKLMAAVTAAQHHCDEVAIQSPLAR